MPSRLFTTLLFISLMGIYYPALAGPDDNEDPPQEDVVPIDGGVSALVGAAVIYGVRKMNRKKGSE